MRDEMAVLTEYVRKESGFKGTLDPDADLLEENILDSFSIIQLVVFVQETFGVELDAEDLTRANLGSLSKIVALIDKRRPAANS